jgi:transposase-like protein
MAFKQKVVSEIEYGRITVGDAERIYGINGHGTIDKWLKKFGKNHLLAKVVRIEMKDEKDRVRELEKEKRVLETALGQSQLKIMMLERYVEIAKDKYGIDLKKKNGTDVLDGVSRRSKKLA